MTTSVDKRILAKRYAKYITAWNKRDKQEQAEWLARAAQAEQAALSCAKLLADEYRVRRVWLIGSLLHPKSFRQGSDIDLAVEGLAAREYFSALSKLYQILPEGLKLDLITIETAQPSLRKHIQTAGRILYE